MGFQCTLIDHDSPEVDAKKVRKYLRQMQDLAVVAKLKSDLAMSGNGNKSGRLSANFEQ